MSEVLPELPQALIVRPQVLPSLAQFEIERQLAGRLFKARGFLPSHYMVGPEDERFAKVLAAIEYGRAVGIEPMIALQNLTNIDGKIGATALLVGAQLRKAGYEPTASWYDQEGTTVPKESPKVWGCKVVISKSGRVTGDGVFSLTDAQRAHLLDKTNWKTYPKDMLYARALTQAAREGAQDAVLGMAYTAEELGAEVDGDGQVVNIPPPPGGIADAPFVDVIEGEVVGTVEGAAQVIVGMDAPSTSAAPGVSEATAGTQLPTAAAIQPTPPAPPVEARTEPTTPAVPEGQATGSGGKDGSASGADSVSAPPQSAPVAPLSGPALARRMGAGRSIGPAPKRTNVVTVEQGAEKPATAPEAPAQAAPSAEVVASQPAPSALTDDPELPAAPVNDGLDPQREILRQSAGDLLHVNAILENVKRGLEGKEPQTVPSKAPSEASDQALASRIDTEWPGRKLANLKAAELQSLLERFEANLSKKRSLMLERGISEE